MNNIKIGFILTSIAGLSTLIGALIIFFKGKQEKIIAYSLSFATGVMITVSLLDLIPEAFNMLSNIYSLFPTIIYILIYINIGFIFSMLLDKYLPDNNNKLYRVGIISMLAIILHNIPEGIATFMATNSDISLGISLTIAIALHNIPEGISIAIPIYFSSKSHLKAIVYTLISGLSELLGAVITYFFLSDLINDKIMGFLFSFIAGIMIYISIYELFPTALKYRMKKTYLFLLIGIIFMIINLFLF